MVFSEIVARDQNKCRYDLTVMQSTGIRVPSYFLGGVGGWVIGDRVIGDQLMSASEDILTFSRGGKSTLLLCKHEGMLK